MILGIDLGTTNSAASVWKEGKSVLIPNSMGKYLTPSVVGVDDNGEILVGEAAKERLITHPQLTASVFKRYMGTSKEFELGKQTFRPEDLSALILKSIKKDSELFLGEKISEAVITVPAYFNDTQRKATRIAGELSGLKVERLLNEPTAAALSYGLHLSDEESSILIFDLGGGTFDISVLEFFEGVIEVRASAGDSFLGGEDFRKTIIDSFLHHLSKNGIKKENLDPLTISRIESEAEKAKKTLSKQRSSTLSVPLKDRIFEFEILRDTFEKQSRNLIDRLQKPLERAIRDSKIKKKDLDAIIMVGGATRMPVITQFITKTFSRFPSQDIDPDLVVAMGAGIQAALKEQQSALDEIVLTDICPYTLGIEISKVFENQYIKSGRFLPIIERNTVVPTSRLETVVPISEKQDEIELVVYQGESYHVSENIFLGRLQVPLPKASSVNPNTVDVRFTYDINGILEVEATVKNNDAKYHLIIEENPGALSPDQIKERLEFLQTLKIHPRDDTRNIAILSRAKRLYEEFLGERRDWIGQQMEIYQLAIDNQDQNKIDMISKQLIELMDTFENDY